MLNVIKRAAVEAMATGQPVAILFGNVTNTNPLEVNVDQRFTLDADFFIVPEVLTKYELQIGGNKYVIRSGLKPGDQVILLRMQGGQKYLILDKAVSA